MSERNWLDSGYILVEDTASCLHKCLLKIALFLKDICGDRRQCLPQMSFKNSIIYLGKHMICCAQSCLCDPMDFSPPGSSVHVESPGKKTGVGCHAHLQGIFPTRGSNPGLLHCRQILYHLSHQGRPT